ncbi:phage tail protein [Clostridium butyricum]|uniref:phage tail protein n=1 Tax=Clostridium butyricum TaxID=1492 RepID=UPI0022E0AA2F|nr:phage tail protein [Clostridium butyricum]
MDLNKIDLLSLQTSYMQKDNFVQALCKALNPVFQKLSDSTRLVFIYGRIDELEYTLSLDQKRELVKKSIYLHMIKGTSKAVEEACTTVFGKTKLKEWFEYGGKPYFFGLDVDITEVYKNKRSWIDYINLFIASKGDIYIGASTLISEEISVLPWNITEINAKFDIEINARSISSEIIEIYPREE